MKNSFESPVFKFCNANFKHKRAVAEASLDGNLVLSYGVSRWFIGSALGLFFF